MSENTTVEATTEDEYTNPVPPKRRFKIELTEANKLALRNAAAVIVGAAVGYAAVKGVEYIIDKNTTETEEE